MSFMYDLHSLHFLLMIMNNIKFISEKTPWAWLAGPQAWLDGPEGEMEGRMYGQKISPFYRTLSPIGDDAQ